jgi:amino acid transporter
MEKELEILSDERKYLVSLVLIILAISTGAGAYYYGQAENLTEKRAELHKERMQFYLDNDIEYDLNTNNVIGVYSPFLTKKIQEYHEIIQSHNNQIALFSLLFMYMMPIYFTLGIVLLYLIRFPLLKKDFKSLQENIRAVRWLLVYIILLLGSAYLFISLAKVEQYAEIMGFVGYFALIPYLVILIYQRYVKRKRIKRRKRRQKK